MSTSSPPAEPQAKVPPEEKFWKRYSPHHEAPLSGITSLAVHLLAIPLLLLIGWVAAKVGSPDDKGPVNQDPVRVIYPGGGGSPGGKADGSDGKTDPRETGSDANAGNTKDKQPLVDRVPLTVAQAKGIEQEFDNDPAVTRIIKLGTEATDALFRIDKNSREALRKNVNPSVGQGGSGKDGGRDKGKDKGMGGGMGDRGSLVNDREKRVLRWAMTFNTQNGQDYSSQLQGLGAIVAIPLPGQQQSFSVIRNLRNPATAKMEDVSKINRIYWVDDKPPSVHSLCRALGIQPVPPYFVAFFPEELERKLLDIELAWMKDKYGFADENQIHETKFDVIRVGGKYDVRVRAVTLNK